VCPEELILHPYYIPERKTRPRGERRGGGRRSKSTDRETLLSVGTDYPRRKGEGGSGGVMATRAGAREEMRWYGEDTRGVLFWPRGTSRPSSTSSSGTPRRRPRVMKPRPPQSKHASSLPPLELSKLRSFFLLSLAKRSSACRYFFPTREMLTHQHA
jgi:hypothetical protein